MPGSEGRRRILRVGLTGNIAAGKSTVAAWLAEGGCNVIDADLLARECLEPGRPAHLEVVEAFGREILRPDGQIDRQALGRRAFSDRRARRRLEEILHPRIQEEEEARWAREDGDGIVVTEAALLYEAGAVHRYHRMVVVTAPEDVRLRRLLQEGLPEEQARERMAAQMEQAEKARRADYVVDNGGSLEATRSQVDRLLRRLGEDLQRLRDGEPLPAAAPL